MKVRRDELPLLDPPVRKRVDEELDWKWAIVYAFVPGANQDVAVAQKHLDFFCATGFAVEAYKPDNWHGGRLVDLNDLCSPFRKGWYPNRIRPRAAETWFWTLDFVRAPAVRRTIVRPKSV